MALPGRPKCSLGATLACFVAVAPSLAQTEPGADLEAPSVTLKRALVSDSAHIREAAITQIAQVVARDKAALPLLVWAIHSSDARVKEIAYSSLKNHIPDMLRLWENQTMDVDSRASTALALTKLAPRNKRVFQSFLAVIENSETGNSVRGTAVRHLCKVAEDSDEAIPILIPFLNDVELRGEATRSLCDRKFRNKERVLSAFVRVLEREKFDIPEASGMLRAIDRIGPDQNTLKELDRLLLCYPSPLRTRYLSETLSIMENAGPLAIVAKRSLTAIALNCPDREHSQTALRILLAVDKD